MHKRVTPLFNFLLLHVSENQTENLISQSKINYQFFDAGFAHIDISRGFYSMSKK